MMFYFWILIVLYWMWDYSGQSEIASMNLCTAILVLCAQQILDAIKERK